MFFTGLALVCVNVLGAPMAVGQTCKPDDISAVIDQTGARLRQINSESLPRIQGKLRELGKKRGWNDSELETKGLEFVADAETRAMDQRAGDLLATLDRLGDDSQSPAVQSSGVQSSGPQSFGAVCNRLEAAKTASLQLIEVTSAKSAHVAARLEATLRPSPPPAPAIQERAAEPIDKPASRAARAPLPVAPKDASPAIPKVAPVAGWDTRTVRDAEPTREAMATLPPPADPGDLGFSPEDIRAAGRGLFGSISASLASVIDHAFTRYGRPTGYILGNEGGGAFLAGLRYGDGLLVTKQQGERKVYWQGPSVGYDFGLAGSRVMFLVYNVDDHEQLFSRFAGVDGSAYLVGGVGITFLKRGRLVLAPIRTGLGLRLGANVGYLKFTPTPSLNPF